ncbi:MAG: hypothetical protein KatS3mg125_1898 [Lysobacterales bacterium]|jgi:predicted acyltransferase (DUF342 family)|nr:MAG: hypothetical protein KatS3mg125_1898 [Xanthomonadales bacterium]
MNGVVRSIALSTSLMLSAQLVASDRNVEVRAGEEIRDFSTVHGSIELKPKAEARRLVSVNGHIGTGAEARIASAESRNGSIRIGPSTRVAEFVKTLNGSISLGENVEVGGDVSVQNGEIRIGRNARVGGSVSVQTGELIAEEAEIVGSVSVGSGALKLRGGRLGGDVRAHTADVELMQGVVVEGDLRLGKSSGMSGGTEVRVPGMSIAVGALGMAASRVVIGPRSELRGRILGADLTTDIWVHETARIGRTEGASIKRFRGEAPPSDEEDSEDEADFGRLKREIEAESRQAVLSQDG